MAMLVSWSGHTLIGHVVVINGPWVNPRHGRGPQDQVTALAKSGTAVVNYVNARIISLSLLFFIAVFRIAL